MTPVVVRIPLTLTSAATTAYVGIDALSEVPPAIADDDGESACSMVDDVPMSPVNARLPPTLASTATAAASDKPEEVPVICDAVERRRVVDRMFPCHLLTLGFHPLQPQVQLLPQPTSPESAVRVRMFP